VSAGQQETRRETSKRRFPPVFGGRRESCRKDGGKGIGRVDFAGVACYCKKVAMVSRVFGRQKGRSAIHWKSSYTARFFGFLA
jgi:hypothetical protein